MTLGYVDVMSDGLAYSPFQQLQDKNDPNISMCPSDHPFISIPTLETEGHKLLEGIITMLYSSK